RVINYFKNISFTRIRDSVFVRIPKWILGIKCADFIVLGGKCNSDMYLKTNACNNKTKIKYIHSTDFDNCIQSFNNKRILSEKYCLFIDQYFPYHPDGIELGFKLNSNTYYNEMRNFFRFIEENHNIKVVIGLHPRSNYSLHQDAY